MADEVAETGPARELGSVDQQAPEIPLGGNQRVDRLRQRLKVGTLQRTFRSHGQDALLSIQIEVHHTGVPD